MGSIILPNFDEKCKIKRVILKVYFFSRFLPFNNNWRLGYNLSGKNTKNFVCMLDKLSRLWYNSEVSVFERVFKKVQNKKLYL